MYDFYYIGRRKGTTERGEFYAITIMISEVGENTRSFQTDFFVNAEMFVKCENFQKFQTVDCLFIPTSTGRAKLVEIG